MKSLKKCMYKNHLFTKASTMIKDVRLKILSYNYYFNSVAVKLDNHTNLTDKRTMKNFNQVSSVKKDTNSSESRSSFNKEIFNTNQDHNELKKTLIARNSLFKRARGLINFVSENAANLDLDIPHQISVKQFNLATILTGNTNNILIRNIKDIEVYIILFPYFIRYFNKNKFLTKKNIKINLFPNRIENSSQKSEDGKISTFSNNINLVFFIKSVVETELILNYCEELELKALIVTNIYKNNTYNSSNYTTGTSKNSNDEIDYEIIKRLAIADVLIVYPELYIEKYDFFKNFTSSNGVLYVLQNINDQSLNYCINSYKNKWMMNNKDRFIIMDNDGNDSAETINSANHNFNKNRNNKNKNIFTDSNLQMHLNATSIVSGSKIEFSCANSQLTTLNNYAVRIF